MRITGQGLTTIAILTAILWGCILAENWTLARTRADANRVLTEIHALQVKRHIVPVTAPVQAPRHMRPEIG